jgi:hypothetical protein
MAEDVAEDGAQVQNSQNSATTEKVSGPGLPDGFFANQKFQSWYVMDGLGMENVGII